MTLPKKYTIYYCSGCWKEFLTPTAGGSKRYCPFCGDDADVAKDRVISIEKTFLHARSWTKQEDETLLYGRKKKVPYRVIAETIGPHRSEKGCRERMQLLKKKGIA